MNVMSIMFFPTHTCKKCGIWHRLRHSYSSEGNFLWRLCREENRVTDVITPLLTSVVQAVKPGGMAVVYPRIGAARPQRKN